MKKLTKVLALVLVLATLAFTLVSCSTYGKIKSALEKKDYVENTDLDAVATAIKNELEKKDLAVEIHMFAKKGTLTKNVLVVEFKATDDMKKAYEDSNTMQGLIKDIQKNDDAKAFYDALVEAGYANGNCLVFPLSIVQSEFIKEVKEIVKNA